MQALTSAPGGRVAQAAGALDRTAFLRPIAHRGLHDRARGRIENSAPAFRAAIARGYGIECDLQAARDGTPMVFHDARLDRLVGASGLINARTPSALARLRYKGQNEPILPFAELLDLVAGRAPLLVEVKINRTPPPDAYLDKIARQARAYEGPIGLMSFDYDVVARLAKLAPTVPRGAVIGSQRLPKRLWATPRAAGRGTLARVFGRAPVVGSFMAVEVRLLRGARDWMERQAVDMPLFGWTIRTRRERATAARFADAPIFEGYEP